MLSLSLTLISNPASGQVQQTIPFRRTGDLVVIDGTGNRLWRLMDLNLDGDYDDAGEVVSFFLSLSGISLANPTNVAVGPDGIVYVCDSTNDFVVRLQDQDGDLVINTAGEATIFFAAATNTSGVGMSSALSITVSADGAVWVASSNTGTAGSVDSVLRLFDLNGNGDAQDAGEAVEYGKFAVGQAASVSLPFGVTVGPNGFVHYLDTGSIGRGIYRMHDDMPTNGNCLDAGEVSPFYLPAQTGTSTPTYQCVAADRAGNFYVTDTTYDRIYRVKDVDGNLSITLGFPEESTYFQAVSPSTMWNVAVAADGSVYAVEDGGTAERILHLVDNDANGDAMGPGESSTVYDDTIGSQPLGSIRSLAFLKAPAIDVTPNPIPIGTGVTFSGEAGAGELFDVWASSFPDGQVVPPYGTVGISLATPGTYFELVPVFVLPAAGSFSFFTPIPADPGLLAVTVYLQAIGGPPNRLILSNVAVVTFQ